MALPAEDPRWFFAIVEPYLAAVREVAGRVLQYAEARGDLPENELQLDDVVDAALARAYDAFAAERSTENIRSRLVHFALEEIKRAARRAKADREFLIHVEEDVPETQPTEEVSTLGDEILDFYQPDEDLKVEDLVPDVETPGPDETVEREELRRCVRDAVRELPEEARRALTLRYIVGIRGEELSRNLRKPEPEIEKLLEDAQERLRAKLVASGCALKTARPSPAH